jgi:hypothetical protein
MHEITVRRMQFDFPDGIDPVIVDGQPEESFRTLGMSLLLPYLEPYLIRTMNEAKKRIADPDLLADLDRFNAQEGQHYRQHRRFNQAVQMAGFPGLGELEAELDADYRRFSEERSLKFNLAYAEGFEALTTAAARYAFESKQFERMHPAARELFSWHLIEELEHRTVAFEVYDHIYGDYFYRLRWGLFAQRHMLSWIHRVARHMEERSDARARFGGAAGRRSRLRAQSWRGLRGLAPKVLATYMPWYTPERIAFTDEMRAYAERFSAAASR